MNSDMEWIVPIVGFAVLIICAIVWRRFKRRQRRHKLNQLREQFKHCNRNESNRSLDGHGKNAAVSIALKHSTTHRQTGRLDPLDHRPQQHSSPVRRQPD